VLDVAITVLSRSKKAADPDMNSPYVLVRTVLENAGEILVTNRFAPACPGDLPLVILG
jgi:hypothetical protein